jgi:hypothetical protein
MKSVITHNKNDTIDQVFNSWLESSGSAGDYGLIPVAEYDQVLAKKLNHPVILIELYEWLKYAHRQSHRFVAFDVKGITTLKLALEVYKARYPNNNRVQSIEVITN